VSSDLSLLVVPYDTGQRRWRMGAGPEHLLKQGLAAALIDRGYAVEILAIEPDGDRHGAEIGTAFALMRALADRVRAAIERGAFPLVLSGNCNSAVGTLAGLTPASQQVYWFDAHADCNTPETTTSGFLDGMALSIAMGWCWRQMTEQIPGFAPLDPSRVLLFGTRDVDPLEADVMARHGVAAAPPTAIKQVLAGSIAACAAEAAYLHCDLDVIDPAHGQANCFPVAGGLAPTVVVEAVRAIARTVPVRAAALTAYAPEYDADGRVCRTAFDIVEALLPHAGTRRAAL
jgi:arginase